MGHGTPDWWGSEPGETTFQVQDVGELAVRLGSIDTFDRRGNVVFIDSFEHGLGPYLTDTYGAGSAVVLSTITARSGVYSCKLATGAVGLAYAEVGRYQPYPVLSKHGLEAAFTVNDNAVDIWLGFYIYDGVNYTRFNVKYLPASDKWQYYGSDTAYHDLITGQALAASTNLFHVAKLVVDPEAGKFYYFLIDGTEVSMAGIAGYAVANAGAPRLEAWIALHGGAAAAATIYVDDIIITQNEP